MNTERRLKAEKYELGLELQKTLEENTALRKQVFKFDQGRGGENLTWKEAFEAADRSCHAWKLAADAERLENTHLQQALEESEANQLMKFKGLNQLELLGYEWNGQYWHGNKE